MKSFSDEAQVLKAAIPNSLYDSILGTNLNTKLSGLSSYI